MSEKKDGEKASNTENGNAKGMDDNILFDIDAIRAEIAKSEKIEKVEDVIVVKEIESTLPSLKISTGTDDRPADMLRQSKSYNDINGKPGPSATDGYLSYSNAKPSSSRGYHSFGGYQSDHGEDDDHHHDDEGEVQMMFEPPSRPELKSSYTTPVPPGRNVWADDYYDDEFAPKGDGELTMTFA